MIRPLGKRTIFAIFITSLFLIGVRLFLDHRPSAAMPKLVAVPTQCVIGHWEQFDMPKLSNDWKIYLQQIGLDVIEISASGLGETTDCFGTTAQGHNIYKSYPPDAASEADVYATIRVESIPDDVALGDIIIKIVDVPPSIKSIDFFDRITLHLTLVANESKSIAFSLVKAMQLYGQGFTNVQLVQAFDGRLILPTETPFP